MQLTEKDWWAISLITLLSLAVVLSTFPIPHLLTLESYSNALGGEKVALKGEWGDAFHMTLGFFLSRLMSFQGGFDLQSYTLMLKLVSPFFALLFSSSLYFLLRKFYGEVESATALSLMILSAPFFFTYASGILSGAAPSLILFTIALTAFLIGTYIHAFVGGILISISLALWNNSYLLFLIFIISIVAEGTISFSRKAKLKNFATRSVLFLAVPFLSLFFTHLPSFNLSWNMPIYYVLPSPLFLSALLCLLPKFRMKMKHEPFLYSFFILSLILLPLSSPLPLLGLAVGAALGMHGLKVLLQDRWVRRILLGSVFLVLSFLMLAGYLPILPASVFSVLISLAGVFLISMYEEEKNLSFFIIILPLLVSSLFLSFQLSIQQNDPIDEEAARVMDWIRDNIGEDSVIGVVGPSDLYSFLTQREIDNSTKIVDFLMSRSSPSSLEVDYLLLDFTLFDNMEQLRKSSGRDVRIESYEYVGLVNIEGKSYFVFLSTSYPGRRAYIPIDPNTGSFHYIEESLVADPSGVRAVPTGRFVPLRDSDGRIFRMLYPRENYDVNLFNIFVGGVDDLKQVYPTNYGRSRLLEVKG